MGYDQQINLWFQQFDEQFNTIVPNVVAETAVEFFKSKFKSQEWEGVPWQALSPKYAANKTQGKGRILFKTSKLMNSINPSFVSAERVSISAGNRFVPYARVHNEGLRVRGVRYVKPFTNTNFMGKGKRVQIGSHARKVDFKMPKRQYMGPSATNNKLIRARLVAAWNARQ